MNDQTRLSQRRGSFDHASSFASSMRPPQDIPHSERPLPAPPSQASAPPYPPSQPQDHMRAGSEHEHGHGHGQERRRGMGVHSHSTSDILETEQRGLGYGQGAHGHRHSHGAVPVPSRYPPQPNDAYGQQTWVDFLREPGAGDPRQRVERYDYTSTTHRNPNDEQPHHDYQQQPFPNLSGEPSSQRFIPPAYPVRTSSASTIPGTEQRYSLPVHPARTSSTATLPGTERKRRLTTAETPARRPFSRGTSFPHASGSAYNPSHLDGVSSAPLQPSVPPSLPTSPPPRPSPYRGNTSRRESNMSDIALPPWQPDAEVNDCPVCGSRFSFFYRKHHCRKCGRVVCAACSPHRITIPRQYIVHPPSETDSGSILDISSSGDDDNNIAAFGLSRNLGGGQIVRVCNPCVPDPNFSPPPQPPAYTSRRPEPPSSAHHSLPRRHRSSQSANDISQSGTYSHRPHRRGSRDDYNRDNMSTWNSSHMSDVWRGETPSAPAPGRRRGYERFLPNYNAPEPSGRAPRRQIPEEDECPVCGNELPPKGPDGDESAREAHVNECITSFAAPPPPMTSTSLPATRTRGMSNVASAAAGGSPGPSNRLSMFARGLCTYLATEKDRVDEGGERAECVICFEEFEEGDRMARLVCLCSFHENCIRAWWDKKGRGACPTHQLHEHE